MSLSLNGCCCLVEGLCGSVDHVVRIPNTPTCHDGLPWVFPGSKVAGKMGMGGGSGVEWSGAGWREKADLASGLRAEVVMGPSSRGRHSPKRGSWSFGVTLGWEGCSGWSCWKLWNALESQSPLRRSP